MGKLIACAAYEGVKGITRIELGGGVPVKPLLPGRNRGGSRNWRKADIGTHRRRRARILFRGDKLDLLEFRSLCVHGFLDEVAEFVLDVVKLGGRHADKNHVAAGVAEARGLKPGVVGMAADFFLECSENS